MRPVQSTAGCSTCSDRRRVRGSLLQSFVAIESLLRRVGPALRLHLTRRGVVLEVVMNFEASARSNNPTIEQPHLDEPLRQLLGSGPSARPVRCSPATRFPTRGQSRLSAARRITRETTTESERQRPGSSNLAIRADTASSLAHVIDTSDHRAPPLRRRVPRFHSRSRPAPSSRAALRVPPNLLGRNSLVPRRFSEPSARPTAPELAGGRASRHSKRVEQLRRLVTENRNSIRRPPSGQTKRARKVSPSGLALASAHLRQR